MKKLINSINDAFWQLHPLIGSGIIVIYAIILGIILGTVIKNFGSSWVFIIIAIIYLLYCLICFIRQIYKEYNKEDEKTN